MRLPQIPVIDINAKDQLLLRLLEGEKHKIRVVDRLSGQVVSEMPSMCDHTCYLKSHPTDDDSVLEKCSECEVIRVYKTVSKICTVYAFPASEIVRICDGPRDSILALDGHGALSKLKWNSKTQKLRRVQFKRLPLGTRIQSMCFVKSNDIFVAILSKEKKRIVAWELDNFCSPTWELPGHVEDHDIDPVSMISDTEGNVYIDDGANNRILKIKSSTGNVLSILLLKKNWETIRCLCWSQTHRNLIVQRDNRISSYSFTK